MEPISQTILFKLLTNGIGSLVHGTVSRIFGDRAIEDEMFATANLEFILEQHLDEIDVLISDLKSSDLTDINSINTFYKYPEIENVVRQIYSSYYQKENEGISSLEDIENEFNLLFSSYFNLEARRTSVLSKKLFSILIEACEESAKVIMLKSPEIAAHEVESEYRDQLILDYLKQVKENTSFLLGNKVDIKEIHQFNKKYRKLLQERSKCLKSAAYDGNTRKPIDKIYVCPSFVKFNESAKFDKNSLTYEELLSNAFRVVLLGDPGTGKSTFTTKVSYDLTVEDSTSIFNEREMTPFTVVLREYQVYNKKHGYSILEFMENEINSSFQINPPEGALEYLLLNGYMVVIFDGLDELLDVDRRESIRDQIESFCASYPAVPVIVTSRKIGYENASLNNELFEKYELSPFDQKQIEEYVHKWFGLDPDLSKELKIKQAASFLKESKSISDIRSNSLMLSLLCNIYKQDNYIPENRPKVYQKCADMLFEKWDKHRDIRANIIIPASKVKPLISYLAFWIFEDQSLQQGVTELKLVNKASEYLYDFYEDEDEAREAAEDFINFCKGRAWVFTDTGSTVETSLYQFTHRTFLEYFASDWLTRKYSTTNKLTELLLPKIKQGEWDVVSQLAFQIRGESTEGATEELLSSLIEDLNKFEEEERYNLLSFAVRSLEFMTVKPKLIRDLITHYFDYLIENGLSVIEQIKANKSENQKLIFDLQKIGNKNRETVLDVLNSLIETAISNSERKAILSIEICNQISSTSKDDTWKSFSESILKETFKGNKSLFRDNLHLSLGAYSALWQNSLESFLELHGFEGLLYDYSSYLQTNMTTGGLGVYILGRSCDEGQLKKIGESLVKSQYPFDLKISHLTPSIFIGGSIVNEHIFPSNKVNDPDSLFGVFCLLACGFEIAASYKNKVSFPRLWISSSEYDKYFASEMLNLKPLSYIFKQWSCGGALNEVKEQNEKMGFTETQNSIITDWVAKKTHFVKLIQEEMSIEEV